MHKKKIPPLDRYCLLSLVVPLGLYPVYPLVDALGSRHELVFPL